MSPYQVALCSRTITSANRSPRYSLFIVKVSNQAQGKVFINSVVWFELEAPWILRQQLNRWSACTRFDTMASNEKAMAEVDRSIQPKRATGPSCHGQTSSKVTCLVELRCPSGNKTKNFFVITGLCHLLQLFQAYDKVLHEKAYFNNVYHYLAAIGNGNLAGPNLIKILQCQFFATPFFQAFWLAAYIFSQSECLKY